MPFIFYYLKNKTQHAEVRSSKRAPGQRYPQSSSIYLGKVIDKEKGIFESRKRGIFKYTLEGGFAKADLPKLAKSASFENCKDGKEILDFGASFLLTAVLKKLRIWDFLRETLPDDNDSLMALLFYYIESYAPNKDAFRWLRGSYSKLLFPRALLRSRQISELLEKIGDEPFFDEFFSRYLKITPPRECDDAIIVDVAEAPYAARFPFNDGSGHSEEILGEARQFLVINEGLDEPIYFSFNANANAIADITTLKAALMDLRNYGVSVKYAQLGAEYYSEDNINDLYDHRIQFIMAVPVERSLFANYAEKYGKQVLSISRSYHHRHRFFGVKRIITSFNGHRGYLYICVDHDDRYKQMFRYTDGAISDKIPRQKWSARTDMMGFFGFMSSIRLDPDEALALYFRYQNVEHLFDISSRDVHLGPFEAHSEEEIRGHLLLSFLAKFIHIKMSYFYRLDSAINAESALIEMRNLKCEVYSDHVVIANISKDMKDICEIIGVALPQ
ncbi:MAG: hypothetical protein LBO66_01135 [Deltaproteobacteria bacterium]|jgi:hypothetical protein|nr:hypothetical protein [Deltaproteobacteria bacterium]